MRLFLALLLLGCLTTPALGLVTDEEAVGPFASWMNVKTAYSAAGNGTTDDTSAIQNALNDVGTSGKGGVVYFPAGTYRVTMPVYLTAKANVSLIGADPATTSLKWDGDTAPTTRDHDVMLWIYGTANSRVSRLTFNGNSKAYAAIYQAWEPSTGTFDTGNAFIDNVYKDAMYGYHCGDLGYGCAESTLLRNTFLRLTTAGVQLRNFNALDIWVWDSTFDSCARGVSNTSGAGNWRVYNSYFVSSSVADLEIGNTGVMSARGNTSLNANRFLSASATSNPNALVLQGNIVLDPVQSDAIHVSNQGPVVALDNTVRSRTGATAPILTVDASGGDLAAVGNTFTVSSPLASSGRLLDISTQVVTASSLSGLGAPDMPVTPSNPGRTVFEVTAGANGAAIQTAINSATSTGGTRPIVHLPNGVYSLTSPLTFPANSTIQLVGDGLGTALGSSVMRWDGSAGGTGISIAGPSQVLLRDLGLVMGGSAGIVATNLDQIGSRVALRGVALVTSTQTNLFVQGLDQTLVDARDLRSDSATTGMGVSVLGGPLAQAGTPGPGRTHLFSGAGSNNQLSFTVDGGAFLLVRDFWYETGLPVSGFLDLRGQQGTLSLDGHRIALPVGQTQPALLFDGFRGKATMLGTLLDDRFVLRNTGAAMQVLGLGLIGNSFGVYSDYFLDFTSPAGDNRLRSSRNVPAAGGSAQQPNAGSTTNDTTYITTMLAHLRGASPTPLTALPAGVTDLRLLRVWVEAASVGLTLQGTPVPSVVQRAQ